MLDDLKFIHERDASDVLGVAERQLAQLHLSFDMPEITGEITNVVYSSLGGSGIAGMLALSWLDLKVPFVISRDYDVPTWVGKGTLFIATSYSGTTEETLSAVAEAEKRGATIVIITTGGTLADIARQNGHVLALIPKAEQSRYAVLANFKALVTILVRSGLVDASVLDEFNGKETLLRASVEQWSATVPTDKNLAKRLALGVIGKSAVIYSSGKLQPAAYKWKLGFNENAKHVAWWNTYPEFNHNEFVGWSKNPEKKPYAVIDLRSSLDNPRITERMELSDKLLSGVRPAATVVEIQGEGLLEQLLWACILGDFVTIYTAILDGVNPAPVDLVDKFKSRLS